MIDIQRYLENKLRNTISTWNEADIYAISFFVYTNELLEYKGRSNITEFLISYNTERDCNGKGQLSEERWNYAFWRQNETPIIEANDENEGIKVLFDWYEEKGIHNIGYEDHQTSYDNEMKYVGKGPIGYYELLSEITAVARNMQEGGFIREKFGKQIPIIIHDLEYPWYIMEANRIANPNGEAKNFFAAMKKLGFV